MGLLEGELGAAVGSVLAAAALLEVLSRRGPARRRLGRSELAEHVAQQLGDRGSSTARSR